MYLPQNTGDCFQRLKMITDYRDKWAHTCWLQSCHRDIFLDGWMSISTCLHSLQVLRTPSYTHRCSCRLQQVIIMTSVYNSVTFSGYSVHQLILELSSQLCDLFREILDPKMANNNCFENVLNQFRTVLDPKVALRGSSAEFRLIGIQDRLNFGDFCEQNKLHWCNQPPSCLGNFLCLVGTGHS